MWLTWHRAAGGLAVPGGRAAGAGGPPDPRQRGRGQPPPRSLQLQPAERRQPRGAGARPRQPRLAAGLQRGVAGAEVEPDQRRPARPRQPLLHLCPHPRPGTTLHSASSRGGSWVLFPLSSYPEVARDPPLISGTCRIINCIIPRLCSKSEVESPNKFRNIGLDAIHPVL